MSAGTGAVDEGRPRPAETVAGFLAAMAIFVCLIGIAWHPLRLIFPGIVLALIAVGIGGRYSKVAAIAVAVGAISFFLGMVIAVVTSNPLW